MTDSKVDIANQALARLGEPSIASFDDDSDAAERVNALYETVVQRIMSMKLWRFASTRQTLNRDANADRPAGWDYGYLLPVLKTVRIGQPIAFWDRDGRDARRLQEFEISGRWVFTNEPVVICQFVERKKEALWPAFFVELVAEGLAAKLALPITENQTKEEHHTAVAFGSPSQFGRGGLFRIASESDDLGDASQSLLDEGDPITGARFGG